MYKTIFLVKIQKVELELKHRMMFITEWGMEEGGAETEALGMIVMDFIVGEREM